MRAYADADASFGVVSPGERFLALWLRAEGPLIEKLRVVLRKTFRREKDLERLPRCEGLFSYKHSSSFVILLSTFLSKTHE